MKCPTAGIWSSAQAIIRTHAVDKIHVRTKYTYDPVDTKAVRYIGYNKSRSRSIQAVDATMGQVLKYGSSLTNLYSSQWRMTEVSPTSFADLPYLIVKEDPMMKNTSTQGNLRS